MNLKSKVIHQFLLLNCNLSNLFVGGTISEQFDKMIAYYETRNAMGSSAGFETHPDITPFDTILGKVILNGKH